MWGRVWHTHMFGELVASTIVYGWSDGMNAGWLACSPRLGCTAFGRGCLAVCAPVLEELFGSMTAAAWSPGARQVC
jgi:hypothetical protein